MILCSAQIQKIEKFWWTLSERKAQKLENTIRGSFPLFLDNKFFRALYILHSFDALKSNTNTFTWTDKQTSGQTRSLTMDKYQWVKQGSKINFMSFLEHEIEWGYLLTQVTWERLLYLESSTHTKNQIFPICVQTLNKGQCFNSTIKFISESWGCLRWYHLIVT